MHLVSVNLGTPRPAAWAPTGRTSIEKAPVTGPVEVGPLGLAGDQVSNSRYHGGPDKAVYAFAREELDRWGDLLTGGAGQPLPDGFFGENLTTAGVEVDEAEIGERWRIGEETVVEVAQFRTPCRTFQAWLEHEGLPARGWLKRFTAEARPGAYLRVVVPGTIRVGDEVSVVHRPGSGVTVASWFREVHGLDRGLGA